MYVKIIDEWRHANEVVAFALIAILTSIAVTLLAIARRTGAVADAPAADAPPEATLNGLLVVGGVALAAGAATFFAQVSRERRAAKRYSCRLPCEVNLHGAILPSRLVNISENGAQIRTKGFRLREGDVIRIRVDAVGQEATVVWSDAGRAGMKFSHRMTYDAFRAVLARARKGGSLSVAGDSAKKAPSPAEKGPSDQSER